MSGSGPVTFVYADWTAAYPEFTSTVNATQAQNYFDIAGPTGGTGLLDNTGCGFIPNPPLQTILYLLTAHVAQLLAGSSLQANSSLVGRLSQATQGSVNVS